MTSSGFCSWSWIFVEGWALISKDLLSLLKNVSSFHWALFVWVRSLCFPCAVTAAEDLLAPPHDTSSDLTEVMEQINSTFPSCCREYTFVSLRAPRSDNKCGIRNCSGYCLKRRKNACKLKEKMKLNFDIIVSRGCSDNALLPFETHMIREW